MHACNKPRGGATFHGNIQLFFFCVGGCTAQKKKKTNHFINYLPGYQKLTDKKPNRLNKDTFTRRANELKKNRGQFLRLVSRSRVIFLFSPRKTELSMKQSEINFFIFFFLLGGAYFFPLLCAHKESKKKMLTSYPLQHPQSRVSFRLAHSIFFSFLL